MLKVDQYGEEKGSALDMGRFGFYGLFGPGEICPS